MKIALLFPNNLFTSPYLKYYTTILEKEKIAYDLIIWDRENINEPGCIAFRSQAYQKSKISKARDFYRFRRFIIKQFKKTKYRKVIVYTGQLGILLSDFLIKNYKNRYVLDIRDYSNPMHHFKNRFHKLIASADFVALSSNGFMEWLPKAEKYILSHNINVELIHEKLGEAYAHKELFNKSHIQVDTIGQIKDFESDHRFVKQLKNDDRYRMNFIGFGPTLDVLKEFVKTENISNVDFHGSYKKKEEEKLLSETDFINILITLSEFNKGTSLLSNRLYLSALFGIPCIVNSYTAQSKIIEKYGFGVVIDNYEDLPARLIEYQKKFDLKAFNQNCQAFLKDVSQDYEVFNKKLVAFVK